MVDVSVPMPEDVPVDPLSTCSAGTWTVRKRRKLAEAEAERMHNEATARKRKEEQAVPHCLRSFCTAPCRVAGGHQEIYLSSN